MMEVDDVYRCLGRPGIYHVVIYLLLCVNYIPIATNHLIMAIYGWTPPHHCRVSNSIAQNWTEPNLGTSGGVTAEKCEVFVNMSVARNASSEKCSLGWEYETLQDESTIVTEWDLVCGNAYLVSLATTIYFSGVMLGGLIFGMLSDKFGRKPVLLATLYSHILVGVGLFFSNGYIMFVVLRFFQGVLMQGLQTSAIILIMEMFPTEYRTTAGIGVEIFWSISLMTLAAIAFLVKNWRLIQLAITVPYIITLFYICALPESVRWLVTRGQLDRATHIVKMASKINKVSIPEDPFGNKGIELTNSEEVLQNQENDDRRRNASILDMFTSPQLRKRSFILFYLWFAIAVGYYGLSLSATSMSGNRYLNFFISGAAELPAYLSAIFIFRRFGRRRPLCVYFLIGGAMCIIAGSIPSKTGAGADLRPLATVLALIGKFCMAGCFSVIFLYSSEMYPTVIRNISLGTCAFWARLGGVVAPQILLMGRYTFSEMPVILFGSLALVGGFLTLLLPETLNVKLLDTIEQTEENREARNHTDATLETTAKLLSNTVTVDADSEDQTVISNGTI